MRRSCSEDERPSYSQYSNAFLASIRYRRSHRKDSSSSSVKPTWTIKKKRNWRQRNSLMLCMEDQPVQGARQLGKSEKTTATERHNEVEGSLPLVFSFLLLALYFSLVPLFSSIYVKSSSTSLQIPRYLFELCTYILFLSVWIILCTVTCL